MNNKTDDNKLNNLIKVTSMYLLEEYTECMHVKIVYSNLSDRRVLLFLSAFSLRHPLDW